MKIEILGTGCPKCKTLTALVTQAVADTGMDAVIAKVEDLQEIMNYGVMSTPALVIDGQVKVAGRLPSMKEIIELLKSNIKTEDSVHKCCADLDDGDINCKPDKDEETKASSCGCSGGCC